METNWRQQQFAPYLHQAKQLALAEKIMRAGVEDRKNNGIVSLQRLVPNSTQTANVVPGEPAALKEDIDASKFQLEDEANASPVLSEIADRSTAPTSSSPSLAPRRLDFDSEMEEVLDVIESADESTEVEEKEEKDMNPKDVLSMLRNSSTRDKTVWSIHNSGGLTMIGNKQARTSIDGDGNVLITRSGKSIKLSPQLAKVLTGNARSVSKEDYETWRNFVGKTPSKKRKREIDILTGKGITGGAIIVSNPQEVAQKLNRNLKAIQAGNDSLQIHNESVEMITYLRKQGFLSKKDAQTFNRILLS